MFDCDDNEEKLKSIFEEEVTYSYDPESNIQISNTTYKMRGLVNNYSDPISSVLAKLYESLLIRIYKEINIDVLLDVRVEFAQEIEDFEEGGFFDRLQRKDKLKDAFVGESFKERIERMLFEIQDKYIDNVIIYEDLSNITFMNVALLSNYCSDMAELEMEFVFGDIDLTTRKTKQNEIIKKYADLMTKDLISIGITLDKFNYQNACDYLKCVY